MGRKRFLICLVLAYLLILVLGGLLQIGLLYGAAFLPSPGPLAVPAGCVTGLWSGLWRELIYDGIGYSLASMVSMLLMFLISLVLSGIGAGLFDRRLRDVRPNGEYHFELVVGWREASRYLA